MKQKIFWCFVLGACGLLANRFAIPVFGELEIRFGGVFYLAAAISLGPVWGALAAAASWSAELTADPATWRLFVLACLEALVVGILVRRLWMPPIADLMFWLAVGAPSVWLFGRLFPASQAPWVEAAHLPINGMLCALLADLLIASVSRRWPGPQRMRPESRLPLRRHLVTWLVLAATLPILIIGVRSGQRDSERVLREHSVIVSVAADKIALRLQDHLIKHRQAVEVAAGHIASQGAETPAELLAILEVARQTYPDLSTLLVANREGEIVIGSPIRTTTGVEWWHSDGKSAAEREYFRHPMETGAPFISDVFLGRGYSSAPIVALSAPVFDVSGAVSMVVEASMPTAIFDQLQAMLPLSAVRLTIIDRRQRILYSSTPLASEALQSIEGSELDQALRNAEDGAAFSFGPEADRMLAASSTVAASGWVVIGQLPIREFQAVVERSYLTNLAGLLFAIILALVGATIVAGKITRPLEKLAVATHGADLASMAVSMPKIGSTAPREMAALVDGFAAMAARLEASYQQLQRSLEERQKLNEGLEKAAAELDQRVQERTAELAVAQARAEELQKLYRGLLQGVGAAVFEIDVVQNCFTFISSWATELVGHERQRWFDNPDFWIDILHSDEKERVRALVESHIKAGTDYEFEARTLHRDGTVKWCRYVVHLVTESSGQTRLARGVVIDQTDQHRAHQVQLQHRKLESIGTLAGGIAHDFNNLLTAILGNLSLAQFRLQDLPTDVELAEYLDQMERASLSARDLSQQLLTFAKGGLPIRKSADLRTLLSKAEGYLPIGGNVCVELRFGELWPVELDQGQISQVLQHLVLNAQQAMSEGGTLVVAAQNESVLDGEALPPGRYVRLEICDQGIGIDEDDLPKVFDPYFSTKEAGRGFGLATAFSIVRNHEGHIELTANADLGMTATVWLPAIESIDPAEMPTSVVPVKALSRVLVMDDEEAVRRVAGRMLERLGYEVELTADGSSAVAAYDQALQTNQPFDLVIMDLTVPGGMGGAEAIRRLQKVDPEVRAIVCSGYSNDPVMAHHRQHGFIGVMAKPFNVRELERVLGEARVEAGSY